LNLNLSELLEHALEGAIRDAERSAWLKENEQAVSEYNAQVAKRGVQQRWLLNDAKGCRTGASLPRS
jgi:post-segregation antitoxin (ccd killing protein)